MGRPFLLLRPFPYGCETAFLLVPDTLGQYWCLARVKWYLLPALRKGFSGRPLPAVVPMVARQSGLKIFSTRLGSKTLISWAVFPTIRAESPEARTNLPPSPGWLSMLKIVTPSGMSLRARTLPISTGPSPSVFCSPTEMPSGAMRWPSSPESYLTWTKGAV